jgi:hypothetical protein
MSKKKEITNEKKYRVVYYRSAGFLCRYLVYSLYDAASAIDRHIAATAAAPPSSA